MKLLLDTHTWLHSPLEPERLAPRVKAALVSPQSELWLSPISAWELLLLVGKGLVHLTQPADAWIGQAFARAPMKEAPLTHETRCKVGS